MDTKNLQCSIIMVNESNINIPLLQAVQFLQERTFSGNKSVQFSSVQFISFQTSTTYKKP